MEDKEKQIEEIAQLIHNNLPNIYTTKLCEKGDCFADKIYGKPCWCEYKEIAEKIYCKLFPKDSVVLSKEEYEILQRLYDEIFVCHRILPDKAVENAKILFADQKELIEKAYNQGSKEKAEKILTKIKQFLSNVENVVGDDKYSLYPEIGYKCSKVDDFLDKLEKEEFAKQFGVEIKE